MNKLLLTNKGCIVTIELNSAEENTSVAGAAAEKKVDARTRILKTALSEFATKGFDGVSTTEIAKIAGVTQPLIHYHFKSKLALWQATVEEIFLVLKTEFSQLITELSGHSKQGRLVEVIRGFVTFASKHPEFGQFLLREGTQKTERLEWMIDTWARPTLGLLVEDYRQGVAEGWLKDLPFPQIVSIVMAACMQFYALAPMIESMYGVNSQDPEQVELHTAAVMEMISQAMLVGEGVAA